jgi:hypothetical protein
MAGVGISDIIIPDIWNDYGQQMATERSALWQSGIVASVPDIQLPNGGATINMPFFNDLAGDAETLEEDVALTPLGMAAGKDVAVVIGRGNAWKVNDLAGVFSGADPAGALASLLANYWVRQMQKELIAVLAGAVGAPSMLANVHDISAEAGAAAVISGDTMIDATQKLGDMKDQVTAIAVHSATEARLTKDQLIQYVQPAGQSDRVPMYLGKRVIVDDSMPASSGVYTSYIFGPGAIGYAENPLGPSDVEHDRDILVASNYMTMRRRFLLHPRGIKWIGAPAKDFPTRPELAMPANWTRVYDSKLIRIIKFVHKLG